MCEDLAHAMFDSGYLRFIYDVNKPVVDNMPISPDSLPDLMFWDDPSLAVGHKVEIVGAINDDHSESIEAPFSGTVSARQDTDALQCCGPACHCMEMKSLCPIAYSTRLTLYLLRRKNSRVISVKVLKL